ncbi:ABC transporter substrate-binding protein (plasmid) [Rhodococcus sp. USK10]|uniref:ABC transporter substrate-binding protein n=1 Tax=Rhodococcus sp. USK10 TaxID=2789739 RepID=UPI001C5DA663|nr:ABC transporter substrate-binding protein [Rhodococcus sp. USK10]QYB00226.1 ABC transporter substrate-binding protein [Rhodococcus sp. USK10]
MHIVNRKTIAALGAAVSAVLLAACGSGASSEASSKLTVATSSANTFQAELYIAEQLGYTDKYGVDVEYVNSGALGATQVAAGKADLAQFGTAAAFGPAAQGRDVSIIYGLVNNISRGIGVSTQSPIREGTTEDVLKQLSGAKLVTQGTVGAAYGNSVMVAQWVEDHGGERPTIVSVDTADGPTAQLISGQADAALGLPDYSAAAIAEGKLKMIVPNTDPVMAEITGGDFPAATLFGLKSNLQSKSKAVTGYIAALRDAHQYVMTTPLSEVAAELAKHPAFAGQSAELIESTLKYDPPFLAPDDGRITKDNWDKALDVMKYHNTGQDLTQDTFSYDQIIDMSYWNGATELRN